MKDECKGRAQAADLEKEKKWKEGCDRYAIAMLECEFPFLCSTAHACEYSFYRPFIFPASLPPFLPSLRAQGRDALRSVAWGAARDRHVQRGATRGRGEVPGGRVVARDQVRRTRRQRRRHRAGEALGGAHCIPSSLPYFLFPNLSSLWPCPENALSTINSYTATHTCGMHILRTQP